MIRCAAFILMIGSLALEAQTTQGLISGRVSDLDEKPVGGAEISAESLETSTHVQGRTNTDGLFVLPLLPPGKYRVRVDAPGYQGQEIYELELGVAAFLDLPFHLRRSDDVWESRLYQNLVLPGSDTILSFYGPDLDLSRTVNVERAQTDTGTLESTISQVVNPQLIQELPLAGRDVYTTLVLEPGVAADTTTARGIGVSVDGQRPSSSHFLLDGLENNNQLITGPDVIVAPEAVQEFRLSTNNFSAEYGWTTGYITNAVTKAGTNHWHGLGYFNLMNELLDANDFARNANSLPRNPLKVDQPGFQVGGPLWRDRLYQSASLDILRSRGLSPIPVTFDLPSPQYIAQMLPTLQPTNPARQLLTEFAPPAIPAKPSLDEPAALEVATVSPPIELNRTVALERVDYLTRNGLHHLMGRVAIARLSRPDFIWSPYPQFSSALDQNTTALGVALVSNLRPTLTNELRGSISGNVIEFNRAHPDIPTISAGLDALDFKSCNPASTICTGAVLLPGSLAAYSYRDHSRNGELVDNVVLSRGRHVFKFGGGILLRRLDGYLTFGQDGNYQYSSFGAFVTPTFVAPSVEFGISQQAYSQARSVASPNYDREYRLDQLDWFAQDSFRITPRLTINYGVRYERPGVPVNIGANKDALINLGPGANLGAALTGAQIEYPGSGDQQLYTARRNDWGGRFGYSFSPFANGSTVIRGAFGVFYDRPFDNLWLNLANNSVGLAVFKPRPPVNFLEPVSQALQSLGTPTVTSNLTMYQPYLRSPRAYIFFTGVQRQFGNLALEANTLGAFGRGLITTDIVNRPGASPFQPALPATANGIYYVANQGDSDYNALALLARYRSRRSQFQVAYTWSHSIDNQSEPLLGDYFNLEFVAANYVNTGQTSTFVRQFDSRADRGNSDFDQRHNLVFYGTWESPRKLGPPFVTSLVKDWRLSAVGAIRSGLPYTVYAATTPIGLVQNRADLIAPASATLNQPAPGGKILLNTAAFSSPVSTLGNLGRNSFGGPGFFSTDLSLGRSFELPWLGESGRLTLRADAYNFLNHANLDNPIYANLVLGTPNFGLATYGRQESSTGSPALSPLTETARQVQMIFRIEF